MDFTQSDAQQDIVALSASILGDACSPDQLREQERAGQVVATKAWGALASADLLGLALPAPDGGSGLGLAEAAAVAQQVGAHVAPVPYWCSTAAALAIAHGGDLPDRGSLLAGVVSGHTVATLALWEPRDKGSWAHPAVTATVTDDGYRLDGVKAPVPWGAVADHVVLTARSGDGTGERLVLLVDLDALDGAGLTRTDETVISGEPAQSLHFDGAVVGRSARLAAGTDAGSGADIATWVEQRSRALLLASILGACEQALAITAGYVSEREQFGSPIGTFQAVAHRCADAYVDVEAMRLTTLQALWRIDAGLPAADVAEALDVATYWACAGGQRVVHAAQHLHGGIGVDLDYPIHRYFRWAKVIELLLGGAEAAARGLGDALAHSGELSGGAAGAGEE